MSYENETFREEMRLRRAIKRRVSDKQIAALRLIEEGKVRVEWGMTTVKPCPVTDATLWSLEERGLVNYRGAPGRIKLTAAGKQVEEWAYRLGEP